MLHLLLDTSTWLDLAQRRGGRKWVLVLQALVQAEQVRLLVPDVIVDEFKRNRPNVEKLMTTSLADRFRQIKRDLADHGVDDADEVARMVEAIAFQAPLVGAMNARALDEIAKLLQAGDMLRPTPADHGRVVLRGLEKLAPFHPGGSKNNVADALIIEQYAASADAADLSQDPHAFVTSNSGDFSSRTEDRRLPHPDLAAIFSAEGSDYAVGIAGLESVLSRTVEADYFEDVVAEYDFEMEPRRLDQILEAEEELFDRIWYVRSMSHEWELKQTGEHNEAVEDLRRIAGPARRRIQDLYGLEDLGPYTDFEWGMLHGKMSALRWVLGDEWDFLDT